MYEKENNSVNSQIHSVQLSYVFKTIKQLFSSSSEHQIFRIATLASQLYKLHWTFGFRFDTKMDRILSLRNLDSNTSLSSEAGYETANDDSISSLYYSVNNDTLIDDIVSSPTVHESTIVSDQLLSYVTNVNGEGGSNGLATESTTQTSFEQDIPVSSASAVPPRNISQAVRRATGRGQENDPRRLHVMTRRTVVTQPTEIPRRSAMPLSRRNQVVTNGLTENQPRPGPKPAESHICNICKKSFPLRSTLLVHGKSHNMQCQYCRKGFQKELALSIHLRDNCDKIPLAIRRNILAKEFKSLSSGK